MGKTVTLLKLLRSYLSMIIAFALILPAIAYSQAPVVPTLSLPADNATNQPQSLTLIWNASTGANTYHLQISTSQSFGTTIYDDSTLTDTSQLITGLSLNTTYYWHVSETNGTGTSAYSTASAFTTWASIPTGPAPVDLLSTAKFAILAYSAITNIPSSAITGDVGVTPAAGSFLGLTQTQVTGTMYTVDATGPAGSVPAASMLTTAMGDLTTAYNDAAGRALSPIGLAGNIGGQTLYPGLYKSNGTLEISAGDLTLDANGNPNSVWIFQIATSFNMTSGRKVFLVNGAKASNVFWQVGTAATFGTTCIMKGTIMAGTQITMATGASLEGRALAMTANVTLQQSTVTLPAGNNTMPTVLSTNPVNSSTNVSLNSKFVVNFSGPMDASTITSLTVTLYKGTNPVSGSVTYSGTTATFTPSSNLLANTTYTGTVTTGAKDLAGDSLASNFVCSFTTGTATDVKNELTPAKFSLSQNYPNPFNPTTIIQYSIQKTAMVSLKVYNIIGVEVTTLVNARQAAGDYTVQFNSNQGSRLASGVYFYRLVAGSFVSTKKLILMK